MTQAASGVNGRKDPAFDRLASAAAGAVAAQDGRSVIDGPQHPETPISVGVFVDLEYGPKAGGHVKCWERIAEAAAVLPEGIDLTVYFLGPDENVIHLANHVRYHLLPPAFSSARLPWLNSGAGETDLAPHHRRLARLIERHDVLHATDVFTFCRTAQRVAESERIPLVASIHTDLPTFTEVYSRGIIARMTGGGALTRLLIDRLKLPKRFARGMRRRQAELISACRHVLVSRDRDQAEAARLIGESHVSFLRRGVEKDRFSPSHRDQARLRKHFGIPAERPVLLFVGRIDASKNVVTAAEAARILMDAGHPVHLLAIGDGADTEALRTRLGPHATLPGNLTQDMLSWIYPSCDLFVFPSESEVAPNVVLEAKASGLPVVVSARDGGAKFVLSPGEDGILVQDPSPTAWAKAMAPLIADPVKRAEISWASRKAIETRHPTWREVLHEDLIPVWRSAAGRAKTAATARA